MRSVVEELVDGILEDIALSSHLHSGFVRFNTRLNSNLNSNGFKPNGFDLITTSNNRNNSLDTLHAAIPLHPSDFLPSISNMDSESSAILQNSDLILVDKNSHVIEPRVLQQQHNDACGYYALHNGVVAYQAMFCVDTETRQALLKLLRSPSSFWRLFRDAKASLLAKAIREGDKNWPWSTAAIEEGVMERTYLAYLIDYENQHFPKLQSTTLQFAYGHFTLPCAKILELQNTFNQIRKSTNASHIFFLGILTHWTCALVCKKDGDLSIIYMDSLNRPSLLENDQIVEEWLKATEQERLQLGKQKLTSFQKDVARQSRIDARLVLNQLIRCIHGEDIVVITVNDIITRFLNSFENFVGPIEEIEGKKTEDPELLLSGLIHWLENYWRPATIRDSILNELKVYGHGFLDPDLKSRLKKWCLLQTSYFWTHLKIINDLKLISGRLYSLITTNQYETGCRM